MMPAEWKVGDQLWIESWVRYATSRYATITKVGRKWMTLDEGRRRPLVVCKHSLQWHPSGDSRGFKVWPTKEACEQHNSRMAAWGRLRARVARISGCPDDVTADAIEQAAKLLGIKLGGE